MKVFAVDPGLTRCGMAIVSGGVGMKVELIDVDVIRTGPELPLEERLLAVFTAAKEWVSLHSPQAVAIERVFMQRNISTALPTAQAAGVISVAAASEGIPVTFYTPTEVKSSVTGYGQASKEQIALMMQRILHLQKIPEPVDATDALALGVCHCFRSGIVHKTKKAQCHTRLENIAKIHQNKNITKKITMGRSL